MRKLFAIVGIVLFAVGVYEASETLSFLSRAVTLQGTVVAVETRTGPPKPTQNTPLHVKFNLPTGEERTAVTHLPLLQQIEEGNSIYILVDLKEPQNIRLPLISELWARPLAFLLSGLLVMCVSAVWSYLPKRPTRT